MWRPSRAADCASEGLTGCTVERSVKRVDHAITIGRRRLFNEQSRYLRDLAQDDLRLEELDQDIGCMKIKLESLSEPRTQGEPSRDRRDIAPLRLGSRQVRRPARAKGIVSSLSSAGGSAHPMRIGRRGSGPRGAGIRRRGHRE